MAVAVVVAGVSPEVLLRELETLRLALPALGKRALLRIEVWVGVGTPDRGGLLGGGARFVLGGSGRLFGHGTVDIPASTAGNPVPQIDWSARMNEDTSERRLFERH